MRKRDADRLRRYPLAYYAVGEAGGIFCAACVVANRDIARRISHIEVNWEGTDWYCGDCGERIPSAYAEDEAAT